MNCMRRPCLLAAADAANDTVADADADAVGVKGRRVGIERRRCLPS